MSGGKCPTLLFALPISYCGLRMCDETIVVAVGLRLGLNLWEAHLSLWCIGKGAGTHSLSCKRGALEIYSSSSSQRSDLADPQTL